MARQTRSQRRARREAQQASGQPAPRPRAAAATAGRPAPAPARTEERHLPGSGAKNFVAESWGELKKVEWPNQNQVIQGTIVVIVACAIVGTYLWGADLIFRPFVRNVLLK